MPLIVAGGIFCLGFAVFHLFFWRLFHWKEDLASLTAINRAVMQIMNLCLMFIFLAMAYVSFFHTLEMASTSLGRTLLVAFSLLWLLRAVEQVIFFGIRNRLSVAFTLIFLLGSLIYAVPVLAR